MENTIHWDKLSHDQMEEIISSCLDQNLRYGRDKVLGLPATWLDTEEFYPDAPFLDKAPFLKTLIANPNHIGCHTLGVSEPAFRGTQQIEVNLINICAREIFRAKAGEFDGYVASGGTEANIEGMWVLRNYFQQVCHATAEEIAVVFSEDSHYSMSKGANLLGIRSIIINVDYYERKLLLEDLKQKIYMAKRQGCKYFIVVLNMSTTMFGSVDDIEEVDQCIQNLDIDYFYHIDGAFGGFIYPFASAENQLTFHHPKIISFSLDAHKMLQAPYGTGIFLVRKNFIDFVCTDDANYVKGKDYTLAGSRSGANAIAVWMIMRIHGSKGWYRKIKKLLKSTDWLCEQLDKLKIGYFRNPYMNIVTMHAEFIPKETAEKFHLVPDKHTEQPKWYKIVVMDHVNDEVLQEFVEDLSNELQLN
jgi:tyrosine decarboxylase / aspartate 1-decarboxylase